ncbi:MAG: L-alanine-DL-glutamate epimerase [Candidatus Aminicenantes bacterium]|nr:L-alanine-DL-glutamate epimerase [Candidatus Aminicenantes bacterium]
MRRKEFLELAGAAAAGSLLAGCPAGREAWNGASGTTRVTVKTYELKLRQAWGLSRGTWTTRRNAFIRLERDGFAGLGEAAPIARYDETAESAAAFLEKARPVLDRDLGDYAVRFAEAGALDPGEHAAKAALDMAILDWSARKLGVPLWRLLGLGRDKAVTTTYSIGIDEIPVMQQKVRDAADFGVYKIKVGTADDRKIIEGIRAVTDKPLRADANEGWKTREQALEMIDWMAGQGVELIEQPLPADRLEDYAWLKDRVKIPIFADESLILPSDLPRIAPYFHGVNVKLMKCGGLQEAVRLAGMARALGLKLMIGCMIETSLGISAGAAVASLFDYADLDGNLLISNDPFRGVQTVKDRLVLDDKPGLGVEGDLP